MQKNNFKEKASGLFIRIRPQEKIKIYKPLKEINKIKSEFRNLRYKFIKRELKLIFSEFIEEIYSQNPNLTSIKILDVGCGRGLVFMALDLIKKRKIKFEYYGIDLNSKFLKSIKTKAILSIGSVTKMPYKNNFFDLIVASQVLEHLTEKDLSLALKEIRRVLKSKGLFYLETPNPKSLIAKTMAENWWMFIEETHLTLISPHSMKPILQKIGFSKIKTSTRLETDKQIDEIKDIYSRSQNILIKFIRDYLKPIRHRLLRYFLILTKGGSITTALVKK